MRNARITLSCSRDQIRCRWHVVLLHAGCSAVEVKVESLSLSCLQADAAAQAEALQGGADSVTAELASARKGLAEAVSERDNASSAKIEADRKLAEAQLQLADAKSESSGFLAPFQSVVQGPDLLLSNRCMLQAVTLSGYLC